MQECRHIALFYIVILSIFLLSPFYDILHSSHIHNTPPTPTCVCVEYDTLPAEILLGSTSHLRVEDGEIQIENIPLKSPGRGSHLLLP